jgi:hypothetical protein
MQFFLAVQFLFFAQGGVFQRAFTGGQRPTVSAMYQAVGMENFQVFADCDLGSIEFTGHVRDQHAALAIQDLDYCAPAFFVEHILLGIGTQYDC